jgi:hypothetical protein
MIDRTNDYSLFDVLVDCCLVVIEVYFSAFLSCLHDRSTGRAVSTANFRSSV